MEKRVNGEKMVELYRRSNDEKSPVEIEMERHWQKIEEIETALQSADETDAARLEQQLSYHQSKLTELEGRLNRC